MRVKGRIAGKIFLGGADAEKTKVRPFLPELREKMINPELFLTVEKTVLGSKLAREQFAPVEARVAAMREQR